MLRDWSCDESHMLLNWLEKEKARGVTWHVWNYLFFLLWSIYNVMNVMLNVLWAKYTIICIHCLKFLFHAYKVFEDLSQREEFGHLATSYNNYKEANCSFSKQRWVQLFSRNFSFILHHLNLFSDWVVGWFSGLSALQTASSLSTNLESSVFGLVLIIYVFI